MTGNRPVEIRLLGRFVVLRDGLEVPAASFGGRKVRALLRVLATRRGRFASHDILTEALWGDRPPADPAANLQVLVNRARRALGRPDLVLTGPGGYALAGGEEAVVDAEVFAESVQRARELAGSEGLAEYTRAISGWGGEPLAEDAYADWAAEYRARLVRIRQAALEEAAELALDLGRAAEAVELASEAVATDPLREAAVLTSVRALAAVGNRAAALARYDQYRRALAEELGVDPSPEAQAVQARLLRGQPAGGWGALPPQPGTGPEFATVPFVGRAAELSVLLQALAGSRVVLLSGPSGAGKSRLLEVVARRTPVAMVRAFAAEQDEPWSLARSVVRELLAGDATAAAALPDAMRAALAWLVPEADIGATSSTPDPESRRALLVSAVRHMLAASGIPLVIDDIQWADPTSVVLVESVVARLDAAGVVLASRPDEVMERDVVAGLLGRLRADATAVELDALTARDIAELAGDAMLATQLAASTDGTPLAVVEVLRVLAAEGSIARTATGRWRVVSPLAVRRSAELAAEGQRKAIAARVEAQSRDEAGILHLLALVAREVPARVLSDASGVGEPDVLRVLGTLSQAGLARLGERGWSTAHDMVGDVVVARLAADERGRLHGLLAQALATEAEPGELAAHWVGAGDRTRAADAYCSAAQLALDGFADGEAVTLANAGLTLEPMREIGAALHEIRAQAHARRGSIEEARADLLAALSTRRDGVDRARLLGRMAMLASGADDLVRAAELAELALVEAGEHASARAGALEIAAVLDMNLERAELAEQRAAEALETYQRLGDARGTARVLDGRAMATFLDGQITRGVELLRRAANLFEDSGDLVHVVTPRSTAGHGSVFAGDPAAGLDLATSALELARTLGHPEGETYALWHSTEALAALGRESEAAAAATEALEIALRMGHRGWTATAWRAVGIAAQSRGALDDALQAFEHSLQTSEHLNLFACWASARCAIVLVALGRYPDAEPLVARALSEGPPLGHFEARLAQVELAAARGDDATTQLAANALRIADEAGQRQGRDRLVELVGAPG